MTECDNVNYSGLFLMTFD